MEPIKWVNAQCQDTLKENKCDLYSCETPVGSHGDIIYLLESGWPICPECGDELSPVE